MQWCSSLYQHSYTRSLIAFAIVRELSDLFFISVSFLACNRNEWIVLLVCN